MNGMGLPRMTTNWVQHSTNCNPTWLIT